MDEEVAKWLIEGEYWMRHAFEKQLLGLPGRPAEAIREQGIAAVIKRLKDDKVGLQGLKTGQVPYTSTGNAFWDLYFLADIGLTIHDLGLEREVEEILNLQREDGSFVFQNNMKPRYYCISAILLSSLARMGYKNDPRLKKFVELLLKDQRLDGGWHCAMNRARGEKLESTESCPMDNLNILMLLGQYDKFRDDPQMNGAIDLILDHWARRAEPWRPYGFGIGTQFTKLRYPEVKYGILRVLDALSLFPHATKNPRFQDMLDNVIAKSKGGRYYAESVSRSYTDFDFGQTRTPSRWITFVVKRTQDRCMSSFR
ncbi:MAG: hypothetical protein SA339_06925 [Methanomassiliicoccus sp.]|nr:hypothetical protein [Methanomassiliicoccus sp.]